MSKYPVWTMRLSNEAKARWSEVAEAEAMTLPQFVRRCVEDYIREQAGGLSPRPESSPAEDSILAPIEFDHRVETGDQPKITRKRQLPPSQLELEAEEQDRQENTRRRQDRPNPFEPKESDDEL